MTDTHSGMLQDFYESYVPVDERDKTPADVKSARNFLFAELAILTGLVAAPAVYMAASGKRRGKKRTKREERMVGELSNSSTRAAAELSAFGPAFAIPATYITIQKLEDAGYITKGLGDGVQALLAASATAGLVGGISSLLTTAVKAIPTK